MRGRVLIVAGSDSGGGAGIQADLKTVTCLGGYAMTAITALTAQNTQGVFAIHDVPPAFVAEQIRRVMEDIGADVVKIGMLHRADIVEAVADSLGACAPGIPLVVDPVMVAKGGASLLADEAMAALRDRLVPRAALLTPNLPEARALTTKNIEARALTTEQPEARALTTEQPEARALTGKQSEAGTTTDEETRACGPTDDVAGGDGVELARSVLALGPQAVLLKGGHAGGEIVSDILLQPGQAPRIYEARRIDTPHTHGTGCTLASAIACGLAQGMAMEAAVRRGHAYVLAAIRSAPGLGGGQGPLNHAHTVVAFDGSARGKG